MQPGQRRTQQRIRSSRLRRGAVIGGVGVLLVGVLFLLTRPASTEEDAGRHGQRLADRTRVCMLQDTLQSRAGLEYEHQGKKYYLCCGGCLAAFKGNAARYSTATDPVTGATVDKAIAPIYAYHERAYFFASEESLATFAQDPQRYITTSVH